MRHRVYASIVQAVRRGELKEPITKDSFRNAVPGWKEGTYNAFLYKHRVGNPGGNSELFIRITPGKFKLVRPIKYGI